MHVSAFQGTNDWRSMQSLTLQRQRSRRPEPPSQPQQPQPPRPPRRPLPQHQPLRRKRCLTSANRTSGVEHPRTGCDRWTGHRKHEGEEGLDAGGSDDGWADGARQAAGELAGPITNDTTVSNTTRSRGLRSACSECERARAVSSKTGSGARPNVGRRLSVVVRSDS